MAAGGLIGMLLYRGIGSVGTVIVSLVLVILLSIFYVGLTPYMVWLRIAYEIHERRERRNVAEEDTRKPRYGLTSKNIIQTKKHIMT